MINPIHNSNCDGDKCRFAVGEVRVLPTGPDSNAILCFDCFIWELKWRRERNKELAKANQFKRPKWTSLKVYGGAG